MGAGYDARAVRLLSTGQVQQAYELDVPDVVASKRIMLRRLQQRLESSSNNIDVSLPTCIGIDLNNLSAVESTLNTIMANTTVAGHDDGGGDDSNDETLSGGPWHTIFVFEGVLIYLNQTIPTQLLQLCASTVKKSSMVGTEQDKEWTSSSAEATASLCFADLLENMTGRGNDVDFAGQQLAGMGWDLIDWCPKPGLARHMGVARLPYCK